MERVPVQGSSNIDSIGYDPEVQILEVAFINKKGGGPNVYQYSSVPPNVWVDFLRAPSKGSYLAGMIKGRYSSTKVA